MLEIPYLLICRLSMLIYSLFMPIRSLSMLICTVSMVIYTLSTPISSLSMLIHSPSMLIFPLFPFVYFLRSFFHFLCPSFTFYAHFWLHGDQLNTNQTKSLLGLGRRMPPLGFSIIFLRLEEFCWCYGTVRRPKLPPPLFRDRTP